MRSLILGLISLFISVVIFYGLESQMRGGTQSTFLHLKWPAYVFLPLIPLIISVVAIIYGAMHGTISGIIAIILGVIGVLASLFLMLGLLIGG